MRILKKSILFSVTMISMVSFSTHAYVNTIITPEMEMAQRKRQAEIEDQMMHKYHAISYFLEKIGMKDIYIEEVDNHENSITLKDIKSKILANETWVKSIDGKGVENRDNGVFYKEINIVGYGVKNNMNLYGVENIVLKDVFLPFDKDNIYTPDNYPLNKISLTSFKFKDVKYIELASYKEHADKQPSITVNNILGSLTSDGYKISADGNINLINFSVMEGLGINFNNKPDINTNFEFDITDKIIQDGDIYKQENTHKLKTSNIGSYQASSVYAYNSKPTPKDRFSNGIFSPYIGGEHIGTYIDFKDMEWLKSLQFKDEFIETAMKTYPYFLLLSSFDVTDKKNETMVKALNEKYQQFLENPQNISIQLLNKFIYTDDQTTFPPVILEDIKIIINK